MEQQTKKSFKKKIREFINKGGVWLIAGVLILFIVMSNSSNNDQNFVTQSPVQKTDIVSVTNKPSVSTTTSKSRKASTQQTARQAVSPPAHQSASNTEHEYINMMRTMVLPPISSAIKDLTFSGKAGSQYDFTSALKYAYSAQAKMIKANEWYLVLQPAPKSLSKINNLFGKLINSYSSAADRLISGIENVNVSTINDASAYMNQGTKYMNQTTDLLLTFRYSTQ